MVQSDDLTDKLRPLGHQTLMDILVDAIKPVLEGIVDGRDPVKLGVVGAHHCAVVADKLLAAVTEVPQRLLVKQAILFAVKCSSSCR